MAGLHGPNGPETEPARWRFHAHQAHTTVTLGMLSYIERVSRELNGMREFVWRGFSLAGTTAVVARDGSGMGESRGDVDLET